MEKEITIKVKITEGFADSILNDVMPISGQTERTFDEKVDKVLSRFMNPLYRAMANYAVKEAKTIADAQLKAQTDQAMIQAQQLVVITKAEPII